LLAAKPAQDPETLTPEHEAFITEYLRNGRNGTAAYLSVYKSSSPSAAYVSSHHLLRRPKVAARIKAEVDRLVNREEMSREELFHHLAAIVRADANELTQMRKVDCGACWAHEIDPRTAEPRRQGDWQEPNPDCPQCRGDGVPRTWLADTRKLSPDARALFAGVQTTKDGVKILTHSKLDAAEKIAKIIGAYEADNRQKADALGELLKGIGRSALPVVKDAPE
jgi:phage terminase small subunit